MTSNHLRMIRLADDFARLARTDKDGFHHGTLVGLRSAAAILEDDGVVAHINQLLGLLKRTPERLSSESETVPLKNMTVFDRV